MSTHNMFSWRNKKNINNLGLKKCLHWGYELHVSYLDQYLLTELSHIMKNFGGKKRISDMQKVGEILKTDKESL